MWTQDRQLQQSMKPYLFNDIKALASQLNEKILEAQQRGFKVSIQTRPAWNTDEDFMRETVTVRIWREVS